SGQLAAGRCPGTGAQCPRPADADRPRTFSGHRAHWPDPPFGCLSDLEEMVFMSEQKLGLLGLADLLGQGISEGAAAAERMHLAIADEAFAALDAVPGVSAVSKIVERTHHGIATLCYGAVATLGDT